MATVKIPEAPVFFTQAPTSVSGPSDPIPWDTSATEQLDYEAELGVVIGIAGKDISRARALDHVVNLFVVRHHDEDDLGALADVAHRAADAHAVAVRALRSLRADVVAADLEALVHHVLLVMKLRRLQ